MKKIYSYGLILVITISILITPGATSVSSLLTYDYYGYVKNTDGVYMNGVGVELYEPFNLDPISWTVTETHNGHDGYYILEDIPFSIVQLKVIKSGYETQTVLSLGSRQPRQDIVMSPIEPPGPIESTFKGYIFDNSDPHQYIEGARVYLKYTDDNQNYVIQKTVTGSNGLYEFPTVEHENPKTFTIEAYKSGVRGQTIATTGSISATHWNNFYLDAGTSYAVIIGMLQINLVNQWIDYYMNEMCYDEVYVYGDPSIGEYDHYTADAYENTIKTQLKAIRNQVDSWDIFSLVVESHGAENSGDISILDGFISKSELKSWLPKNSKTFVYLGTCYAAYMRDALKTTYSNNDLFIITATSYSETYPVWSSYLLKVILTDYIFDEPGGDGIIVCHEGNDISMELAYDETYIAYSWWPTGYPPGTKWDGNTNVYFYL